MSRIGKQPVSIPDKVKVDIKGHTVNVEGPKGKISKTFAPVVNITIADKKVTVIDVNGAASYAKGHVPGAVDFASKGADLASVLPADKGALVVAYCGGPQCSAYKAAAKKAAELGYTNVKHLSAGKSGWLAAGEAVEK